MSSKMSTPKLLRQSTLGDVTKQNKRSASLLHGTSPEGKTTLLAKMNKESDWEFELRKMRNNGQVIDTNSAQFLNNWHGAPEGQPPIESPLKKQQIKETKVWKLPADNKLAMVQGGTKAIDFLQAEAEFNVELAKAVDEAVAAYEADMEAELWRASDAELWRATDEAEEEHQEAEEEEAQNKWDEAERIKIEKEINAAEKAYSEAFEARKRAYKARGKIMMHDDGKGVGFHL